MQRHISFILLISALICFPACGQKSMDDLLTSLYKNTVPTVGADSLAESSEKTYFLDTRSPEEYEVSHIRGARMIDYEHFKPEHVEDIPKDAPVVVYCSVGYRSERIGEQLQEMNFTNVRNLYGGIFHWKNEGHPVVNNQNQPTDSVHAYNRLWGQWLNNATKVYE